MDGDDPADPVAAQRDATCENDDDGRERAEKQPLGAREDDLRPEDLSLAGKPRLQIALSRTEDRRDETGRRDEEPVWFQPRRRDDSLTSQSDHGIDARRAPRREI
jgi:hypothetical protein